MSLNISIQGNKMLKTQEQSQLNFYSKYNRSKGKQNIDTLYSLLDDPDERRRLDSLTFTLNVSRDDSDIYSPVYLYSGKRESNKKDLSKERILKFYEQKDNLQKMKMEDKLQKLQRLQNLQRQFQEELNRTEKPANRGKKVYKKNQEKNTRDFITMEEDLSEGQSNINKQIQQQKADDIDIDFVSKRQDQQLIQAEKSQPVNQEESKFIQDGQRSREIIANNRFREMMDQKYVESIEGDLDGPSSIVIERMNIHNKRLQKQDMDVLIEQPQYNIKPAPNYCQPQLSHSQSDIVIPQHREMDSKDENISIDKDREDRDEYVNDGNNQWQQKVLLENTEELSLEQDANKYEEKEIDDQFIDEQLSDNILQNRVNEYHSQVKEQVQDSVQKINPDQLDPKLTNNNETQELNTFHSQIPKRRSLLVQRQVQSIQQQTPQLHPLETFLPVVNISQNHKDSQIDPVKQVLKLVKKQSTPVDKKVSFKKLMASNRANLVPRLAISTILNEHINQVLGDYRSGNLNKNTKLQTANVADSKSPSPTASRVNFKKVLQMSRNSRSGSRQSKLNLSGAKSSLKMQQNRQLLMGFFNAN